MDIFPKNNLIFKEPIVSLFKSKLNTQELQDIMNKSDQDYFNTVLDKIRNSSFYLNKSEDTRDKMVIACLLLDSHWDPINQKILLHTALANGFTNPRLGIFGSHLTHAWPENVNEIEKRFTDSRKIDFGQLANDDSQTKIQALNVGMGAFLQMLCFALQLSINRKFF
jgi:hypothetical protein